MTEHYHYHLKQAINMLPTHMQDGAIRYIEYGIEPGGFMSAVFANNLHKAVARADATNVSCLPLYANLLSHVPLACWGSEEIVADWMKQGGRVGREKSRLHLVVDND